jgi:hypothetical protein
MASFGDSTKRPLASRTNRITFATTRAPIAALRGEQDDDRQGCLHSQDDKSRKAPDLGLLDLFEVVASYREDI